jgi:hypothetical protein
MRKYLVPAAIVAASAVAPAQAITINFSSGTYAVPAYITPASRTTIQNFESLPIGFLNGDSKLRVVQTTIPGSFVDPDPTSNGKYLAVQANGSYTAALGGSQVFSFILGSLDEYNTLILKFATGPDLVLTGQGIVGQTIAFDPNGNSTANVAGRVTYDLGGTNSFVSATFQSSKNSFEIDDLVTAAPEPATWGMMILGFGLAGAQLRSRRRNAKLAVA